MPSVHSPHIISFHCKLCKKRTLVDPFLEVLGPDSQYFSISWWSPCTQTWLWTWGLPANLADTILAWTSTHQRNALLWGAGACHTHGSQGHHNPAFCIFLTWIRPHCWPASSRLDIDTHGIFACLSPEKAFSIYKFFTEPHFIYKKAYNYEL